MPNPLTALLIVDMQNDFVRPGRPLCVAGAAATVPVIRQLLDHARAMAVPVFHIIRHYRPDGSDIETTRLELLRTAGPLLVPGSEGAEVIDPLKPIDGEYVIVKPRFSAFFATHLDLVLRRLGVDHLLLCGTQYPACIRCTAFDAVSLGYATTVVTDATSAQTPVVADANILDMQNAGIRCLTLKQLLQTTASGALRCV